MIVEVLPELVAKEQTGEVTKIGINAIYDAFIERWFDRELDKYEEKILEKLSQQKRKIKKKEFRSFCEKLAIMMNEKGIIEISYKKTRGQISVWDEFFGKSDEESMWCLHACPLMKSEDEKESKWRFLHKTLQDYFVTDQSMQDFEGAKRKKAD